MIEAIGPDDRKALDELEALIQRLPDEEGESA
jgi:hypothetical protein